MDIKDNKLTIELMKDEIDTLVEALDRYIKVRELYAEKYPAFSTCEREHVAELAGVRDKILAKTMEICGV